MSIDPKGETVAPVTAELRSSGRKVSAGFALQVCGAVALLLTVSSAHTMWMAIAVVAWVVGMAIGMTPILLGKVGSPALARAALIGVVAFVGGGALSLALGAAIPPGAMAVAVLGAIGLPLAATAVSLAGVARELRRHPIGPA